MGTSERDWFRHTTARGRQNKPPRQDQHEESMSESRPNTDQQPEASSTVFRDTEQFLSEWHATRQGMRANRRRIAEMVVLQGARLVDVAGELGITREAVRQQAEGAIRRMRKAADTNPQGELAHARSALARISEAAGIPVWEFQRLGSRAQQAMTEHLINLSAIKTEEAHLVPPAARLVPQPGKGRPNLDNAAHVLRRFLLKQSAAVTPETAFRALKPWHDAMAIWPNLDLGKFAVSRGLATITPEGAIQASPALLERNQRGRIAVHMHQALLNAGECMGVAELRDAAQELARQEGSERIYRTQGCAIIASADDRFRWVGNSTYGLAEWDVGHSEPYIKPGRRLRVADEITHLLQDRPYIHFTDLMDHLNKRFQIPDMSVRTAINLSPQLAIRNGVVTKAEHAGQYSFPVPSKPKINAAALTTARNKAGLTEEQMAQKIGASLASMIRYEKGRQTPLPERLEKIAAVLNVAPEDLLGE